MTVDRSIYVGCAGWSLGKDDVFEFAANGTHLQRYASRFQCVEINSSFRRSHRVATYQRWADSTPAEFRFAAKLPKQISHIDRLVNSTHHIEQFSIETAGLGQKLGPVLVQLPPSLEFDPEIVAEFLHSLRSQIRATVVCEPRHPSWFSHAADSLLTDLHVARVAADPSVAPAAAVPGGWRTVSYFRWHGSPRTYYSSYDPSALAALAQQALEAAQGGRPV